MVESFVSRPQTTTTTMPKFPRVLPVLAAVPYLSFAAAYSFNFANTPKQCQNLTVDITGQGKPPYTLLLVPIGPTPLPNAIEARHITNVPFTSSTSVTFQLAFPENGQFVAVVSLHRLSHTRGARDDYNAGKRESGDMG